jgi:hypothetical protein
MADIMRANAWHLKRYYGPADVYRLWNSGLFSTTEKTWHPAISNEIPQIQQMDVWGHPPTT